MGDDTRLSEAAAHRLLERAVELDARRPSLLSVAELREVAREAGITAEAFDEALGEFHALSQPDARLEKRGGLILKLWRRWSGTSAPPPSWYHAVGRNAVALGVFFAAMIAADRALDTLGLDWPARHAADIVGNLLGVGLALRFRARVAAVTLGVVAIMRLAEYPMHLLFGIQTVQGGPTKWALMLAGLLGIALGVVLTRTRRPPVASTHTAEEPVVPESTTAAPPSSSPPTSLRLRTT